MKSKRARQRRAEQAIRDIKRITRNEARTLSGMREVFNLNDQARQVVHGNGRYTPPRPKR